VAGLDHEDVAAAHVFFEFDLDGAVGEATQADGADGVVERPADGLDEAGVGAPADDDQTLA
jgi:hypothetical protein